MAHILYFRLVAVDLGRMTGIVPIMKNNENNDLMTVTSTITNDKYRNKYLYLLDEPTKSKKPAFFKHYKAIASEMELFVANYFRSIQRQIMFACVSIHHSVYKWNVCESEIFNKTVWVILFENNLPMVCAKYKISWMWLQFLSETISFPTTLVNICRRQY